MTLLQEFRAYVADVLPVEEFADAELSLALESAYLMSRGRGEGEGRWITIGGHADETGKKHVGGSPVYIEGGRITKGHPSLVGQRLDRMGKANKPKQIEWQSGGTKYQARLTDKPLTPSGSEDMDESAEFDVKSGRAHKVELKDGRVVAISKRGTTEKTEEEIDKRWHVTASGKEIRQRGFVSGKSGGIGGPVAGQGVSVWKTEEEAARFLSDAQKLEEIRSSSNPLKLAEKLTGRSLVDTDGMAKLWANKKGSALTPRERAVIHVQAILSPYIPASSFFHEGPKRKWENLPVRLKPGAKSRVVSDNEELYDPEHLELPPSHRQELQQSREYERAVWGKKARQEGIPPKVLHSLAGEMLAHDKAFKGDHTKMLQEARRMSESLGYGSLGGMQLRNARGRIDADSIRGLDDIAERMRNKYPEYFERVPDAQDHLFNLLVDGNPEVMTEDEAYSAAFDHLMEEKQSAESRLGSEHAKYAVREGEAIPFSQWDESQHPRDDEGKWAEKEGSSSKITLGGRQFSVSYNSDGSTKIEHHGSKKVVTWIRNGSREGYVADADGRNVQPFVIRATRAKPQAMSESEIKERETQASRQRKQERQAKESEFEKRVGYKVLHPQDAIHTLKTAGIPIYKKPRLKSGEPGQEGADVSSHYGGMKTALLVEYKAIGSGEVDYAAKASEIERVFLSAGYVVERSPGDQNIIGVRKRAEGVNQSLSAWDEGGETEMSLDGMAENARFYHELKAELEKAVQR